MLDVGGDFKVIEPGSCRKIGLDSGGSISVVSSADVYKFRSKPKVVFASSRTWYAGTVYATPDSGHLSITWPNKSSFCASTAQDPQSPFFRSALSLTVHSSWIMLEPGMVLYVGLPDMVPSTRPGELVIQRIVALWGLLRIPCGCR